MISRRACGARTASTYSPARRERGREREYQGRPARARDLTLLRTWRGADTVPMLFCCALAPRFFFFFERGHVHCLPRDSGKRFVCGLCPRDLNYEYILPRRCGAISMEHRPALFSCRLYLQITLIVSEGNAKWNVHLEVHGTCLNIDYSTRVANWASP